MNAPFFVVTLKGLDSKNFLAPIRRNTFDSLKTSPAMQKRCMKKFAMTNQIDSQSKGECRSCDTPLCYTYP